MMILMKMIKQTVLLITMFRYGADNDEYDDDDDNFNDDKYRR